MNKQSAQDQEAALKVTVFASISLAVMIVEYLLLVRQEFKYVWPRLCWSNWSWAAGICMFGRYFGLASQIFNLYFTVRMYLGVPTSAAGCHFWFMFQAVVVQFLLASVEGFLMHRIYALFLRNRLILFILILFTLGQMASMWVSAKLSFPTNQYTSTCLLVQSNPGGAYFSATTMATNVAIFVMTYLRYWRLPAKWTQKGLGWIVFRDSAWTLGAISVMMLFLTLCSLNVIKPHTSGNCTYYWFVGVLWIALGRIIVNHERIRRDSSGLFDNTWSGTLQITSQIEMGERTLTEESKDAQSIQCAPSGKVGASPSASVSKASRLSPLSSPSSACGQKWLGDHPHLDEPWRRSPRPRAKPVLYLNLPVAKEGELSPWSDCTSDDAWQVVEDDAKLAGEGPSRECVDDELQTEDITDAWRDEFADGLSDPGPWPLEESTPHVSS